MVLSISQIRERARAALAAQPAPEPVPPRPGLIVGRYPFCNLSDAPPLPTQADLE